MQSDKKVDDRVVSDNGDTIKVLATVIEITKAFTAEFPRLTIWFAGSNSKRMDLYARILKTYYYEFNKAFHISGAVKMGSMIVKGDFDPDVSRKYLFFLITRKS